PVFPWNKFPGVDTVLGPEMKSTGEVMGVADNFGEAFAKAQTAAGQRLPVQGMVFISVTDHDKPQVAEVARKFVDMGFKLVATSGTADIIERAGMACERVYKVKEGRPNVVDLIKGERIHLIINTPQGPDPFFDEKAIRRAAVTARIPTITTLSAARAAAEGIAALQRRVSNPRAPILRNWPETGRFSAGSVQPLPPVQTHLHPLAKHVDGQQHWPGLISPARCRRSGSTSRAQFAGHLHAPPFVQPVSLRR